jgi:hypothetical protein
MWEHLETHHIHILLCLLLATQSSSSVVLCVLSLIKIDSPKLGFLNRYLNSGHWDFSFTFIVKLRLNLTEHKFYKQFTFQASHMKQ